MIGIIKKLGRSPDAARTARFATLPNYRQGQFQNQVPTPALREGDSMAGVLLQFFRKHPYTAPRHPLPFIKTDLHRLDPAKELLVWFGHSSYFLQMQGLRLLVDPVFSGNASPVPGSVKAFPGSNSYQVADMPDIDVLFISHDHWDHLDYDTIRQLRGKVKRVACGLGVGPHFEYWGWNKDQLIEKNWYESFDAGNGLQVTLTPARHFSGRLFRRNTSLWTSYVLAGKEKQIFLGGDSGYGPHFTDIGRQFGPFDLAILECGQYNEKWPYIHSLPHELVQEAHELRAGCFMPVHHSKFKLAQHPWFEPLQEVYAAAEKAGVPVITPQIGEPVNLDRLDTIYPRWWENV